MSSRATEYTPRNARRAYCTQATDYTPRNTRATEYTENTVGRILEGAL
jgi:hypothetical protein